MAVSQLLATARTLASGIRVEGSRLAILTNGGGPGVMAGDRAADLRVPLADITTQSLEKLSAALPDHWSHANPIDILGDACSERYRIATEILLADENVDGLLVLLSPQGMTDPGACAQGVITAASSSRKPVLTCWLGENLVHEGRRHFTAAGIPSFNSPEAAVEAFGHLAAYRRNQKALLQAPPPLSRNSSADLERAKAIVDHAISKPRYTLTSKEVAALLKAFHIPVASQRRQPVVGAQTTGNTAVRIDIARDPLFGPVISIGPDSTPIESIAHSSVALPPLNKYLARQLIQNASDSRKLDYDPEQTKVDALVDILVRVSEIACELPTIQQLYLSLQLADSGQTAIVTDGQASVAATWSSTERYGHMAIHPYPPGLETIWQLADDTTVLVRPIRPEDAKIEREFVEGLSSQSKYFRFMNHMNRISPLLLARFTQIDYDREMALIVVMGEGTEAASMIGVARYVCNPDRTSCEFALAVADNWQKMGIGQRLMERLIAIARERGLEEMEGDVLAENGKMLRLCKSLGFHTTQNNEEPEIVIVRRDL